MNVGDATAKWVARYPDEPSVKCGDLSFTRREFNNRVNQLARALKVLPTTKWLTAGLSSTIADGSSAVVLMDGKKMKELKL